MKRIVGTAAAALLGLGAGAGLLAAQGLPAYGRGAVSSHGHGTAVASALRLHAGSQADEAGREGAAWLLALVLEDEVARALGTAPALFTASVERATTVFTLVAEPLAWEAAWRTADSVVFQASLEPATVERQRSALLAAVSFEAGSPYREFEGGAATLLVERGSPWARPPRGTPTSLQALGAPDLERYRAAHFERDRGAWAVVGPIAPGLQAPAAPGAPSPSDAAWLTGDRVFVARDVTSTWIAVAYPAPSEVPRTRLELLAHLLREDLDPTPPIPDRYGVDVRVEETPRGAVLFVEASVVPEAAAAWEARILGVVEKLAGDPEPEDFFRWKRRRFRAERLLVESAPEAEAARITADLLRDGRVRDLAVEIWGLDAQSMMQTARSLGKPRILVLGPDLMLNGESSR